MSKQIITAGSDPYPPFQDILDDGSVVGVDIDKLRKVFTQTPYDLQITLCDMKVAFDRFESKDLDSVFLIAKTPERINKGYLYSDFVRNSTQVVVSHDPIITIDQYSDIIKKGYIFGFIPFFGVPQEVRALPGTNVRHYSDSIELLKAVSNKEIDMASFDLDWMEYYVNELNLNTLYNSEKLTNSMALYMCFNDPEIRREFNKALAITGF